MSELGFGRADRHAMGIFAKGLLYGFRLDPIILRSRGPVSIYIGAGFRFPPDVFRVHPSVFHRKRHAAGRPHTLWMYISKPVSIGRRAIAGKLSADGGASLARMLSLFENQHTGTLTNQETVTLEIEGPRCLVGRVVSLREGAEQREASDTNDPHHAIGPPANHQVSFT